MKKLLSVLICTLPERADKLARLRAILQPQIANFESVEVMHHEGGKEIPTGTKRNQLIENCNGEYFCFIDDDDVISDTYVEDIVKALISNPDVVTFNGWMTTNQSARVDFIIRLGEKYEARDGKYYRWPNHLTVMRKSLVEHVKFEPIWQAEDYRWSKQINDTGLLKTEVHIEKELYWYDFIPKK